MKKLWVSIKRGFIREPKHRIAVGEAVWLFMYILDIADWETGIIHDWIDESAAEDMEMPIRTLRDQRRKLDELGYITCQKKQHNQDIIVHNWTNPREYTGNVYNKKQSDAIQPLSKNIQSDTQSDTQSSTQSVTPTSSSNTKYHLGAAAPAQPTKKKGDMMDGILFYEKMALERDNQLSDRVQEYPQDCQQTIRFFVEVFELLPSAIPAKPVRSGKGGDFSLWINEIREINSVLEGFGKEALIAVKKVSKSLSISHPGAIMWALPAEVGKLASKSNRRVASSHEPAALNTPFTRAMENYVPRERTNRPNLTQR